LAVLLLLTPGAALADPPAKAAATAAPVPPKTAPAPAKAAPKSGAPAATAPAKTAAGTKSKGGAAAGKKKKKKNKDAPITGPIATYPAFRMLDGGASRVSVVLSKKVGITEQKAKGKVSYRIQGMQVPTRTNRLALITTFFSTPVSRVELVEQGGDVDLVIDLRAEAAAQYRIVETDRGAELQVDFPKLAADVAEAAGIPAATSDTPAATPSPTKSLESQPTGAY
jgi:hypothetical protein